LAVVVVVGQLLRARLACLLQVTVSRALTESQLQLRQFTHTALVHDRHTTYSVVVVVVASCQAHSKTTLVALTQATEHILAMLALTALQTTVAVVAVATNTLEPVVTVVLVSAF
jgi:hypothetical protein